MEIVGDGGGGTVHDWTESGRGRGVCSVVFCKLDYGLHAVSMDNHSDLTPSS